ncbi:hypothetical protein [Mangrovicoccus sp. HB161399]|uniref:hypothetical protein n=1 Tax=Mangrovicoccus sp. HB161399 TaxID=2720392 RepID=UPI001553A200|nr:hypothetical protein [Mangrovicoccus sp. HB161399]
MPCPSRLLLLPLLAALAGCVPAEYRGAEELGTRSGTTPQLLPLAGLPGMDATGASDPAATATELDARNAALAQRSGALGGADGTAGMLGRAEELRSRAEELRARD